MLGEIVEPRVAAHEKAAFLQRLDVKIGVPERRGVAQDFLDNVRQGDDPLGPAEFIDHDREPLRMGEKTAQQSIAAHRLRDDRRARISVSV